MIGKILIGLGVVVCLLGGGLVVGHVASAPGPGELDLKIETRPTVMTVAYKAYGNPEAADGKYWLSKVVMTNEGESQLEDLKVSYRVPGLIEWTTPDSAAALLPGQTAVLPIYPRFPSEVTQTRTRTPHTLELKIEYVADGESASRLEKRDFELRGVTELEFTSLEKSEIAGWYDMWNNVDLLSAFVTDEDPVVKAYFGKVNETIGGTPNVLNDEQAMQVLAAVYSFQVGSGMVYQGAKGVPEQIGDRMTSVQSVKLPRDVIRNNSGTCVDLSVMTAALLSQAGIKTHMVVIPGHIFPLVQLPSGKMIPFECTGIGGRNLGGVASFQQAVQKGVEHWQKCQKGEQPFVLVDWQAKQAEGLRPPELGVPDLASLEQTLSERVERFARSAQNNANRRTNNNTNNNTRTPNNNTRTHNNTNNNNTNNTNTRRQPEQPRNTGPRLAGWTGPRKTLSIKYPADWVADPQVIQQMQQAGHQWYLFNATDRQTLWAVEVYWFGTNDKRAALNTLARFTKQVGIPLQLGNERQVKINGTTWTTMTTSSRTTQGADLAGQIFLWTKGKITYAVSIGGPSQTAQKAQAGVQAIVNNIQIQD